MVELYRLVLYHICNYYKVDVSIFYRMIFFSGTYCYLRNVRIGQDSNIHTYIHILIYTYIYIYVCMYVYVHVEIYVNIFLNLTIKDIVP